MIVACLNGGKGGRKKACYLSKTIHRQDMCVQPNLEGICLILCIVGSENLPYEKYIVIQLEKKD